MRNISGASLAKIQQRLGAEPYLVVGVRWDGVHERLYGDRASTGFDGRVLEVGGIDDVTKVTGGGSSGSVTVKIDDTDGSIKKVIDVTNPHGQPVNVYQAFRGIDDRFVVFEGQVNTPLVWSEADRTISITVVTITEDRDVGFSAEEGQFPNLPDDAIGKVWPLAFGSPAHVPGLTFQSVPIGTTLTNVIVPDRTLQMYETQEMRKVKVPGAIGAQLSLIYYYMALAAAAGDTSGAEGYNQQAIALQEAANEEKRQLQVKVQEMQTYLRNYRQSIAAMLAQLSGPVTQGSTILANNAKWFPQNTPFYARIGSFVVHGSVTGNVFRFELVQPPIPVPWPYENDDKSPGVSWLVPAWSDSDIYVDPENRVAPVFQGIVGTGPHGEQIPVGWNVVQDITPEGVRAIPAGSQVTIISDVTIDYIVNIVPSQVTRVWAYKSVANLRQLALVPPNYWTHVSVPYHVADDPTTDTPGTFTAEVVRLKRPLSGYAFENWEDQIYVDEISSVGPNTVDVIRWLAEQFTTHSCDPASFERARGLVPDCNFYLDHRGNALAVLSDIAYQAMLALWLKNGVFYLAYLPGLPSASADDTITEDDVEVGSMEISCTATEEIVTKYKATWKPDYAVEQTGTVIVKNNEARYGVMEQTVDYYVYRDMADVQRAAVFWIGRLSTAWKRVTFKTFLNHLNLETFDTVRLDFAHPWVCGDPGTGVGAPVNGLVESASYDPTANDVTLTVWLPIPFGSMTPQAGVGTGSVTTFMTFLAAAFDAPQKPSFYAGTIAGLVPITVGGGTQVNFKGFSGTWLNDVFNAQTKQLNYNAQQAWAAFNDEYTRGLTEQVAEDNAAREGEAEQDTQDGFRLQERRSQQNANGTLLLPVRYEHDNKFEAPKTPEPASTSAFPGVVLGKSEGATPGHYRVNVYKLGTGGDPTPVAQCAQLQISADDTIPTGTWVLVIVVQNKKGKDEYYMQVPVWLP